MTAQQPQRSKSRAIQHATKVTRPYLVFGYHAVFGILHNQPDRIVNLWFDANHRFGPERDEIIELCSKNNKSWGYLDTSGWRQLDVGANAHGVVVEVFPFQYTHWGDVVGQPGSNRIVIALDGVTDPQNLGGILRCAAFFGPSVVLLPRDRSVHVTATVERIAAGGASVVPVSLVTNLARTLEELKEYGYWVYGTSLAGGVRLQDADIVGKVVVVLGAEGQGLRRLTAAKCDQLVTVSGVGVQSLNVATFAGIFLYHVSKTRPNL